MGPEIGPKSFGTFEKPLNVLLERKENFKRSGKKQDVKEKNGECCTVMKNFIQNIMTGISQ